MTLRKGGRRSPGRRAVAASVAEPVESLELRLHLSSSKTHWPWLADTIPKIAAGSAVVDGAAPTLLDWLRSGATSVAAGPGAPPFAQPIAIAAPVDFQPYSGSPPGGATTPAQMRHAYGLDQVFFGSITGDGTGQTIALIDVYHYPSAFSDLNAFSTQFGLPTLASYPSSAPWFRQVAQDGSTNYPINAPVGGSNGGWAIESAIDIEWAHAMAPGANILLVEASDASNTNLMANAVVWASKQPGVVAVSMSFGLAESQMGSVETNYDSYFTTPLGHPGVTFLAATGDNGKPGGYPAYSPNVVAVGGTTLSVSGLNYASESGWNGSGGGISLYEGQPVWQNGVVTQSTLKRTIPDVAIDGDPATGVPIYDSYDMPGSPWAQYGGTSLSTPMWAGVIAVAAQGRALAGRTAFDGSTQTLPALYQLPAADFHDITSGNNGYAAGPGYDLVTGLGTPIASKLINDLSGVGSISGAVYDDRNGSGVNDAGDVALAGATVYLDANNNGVLDTGTVTSAISTDVTKNINRHATATSTVSVSGISAPITDVNVTLSISFSSVSSLTGYLIGPDNTTVQLFGGLSGTNLTNTSFDDQATTSITSGSAPYTGTFRATPGLLAAFNGKTGAAANGTWQLQVVNSANSTGSITAWSVNITAGAEQTATVSAAGTYSFNGVPYGSYVVRQVVPANYTQITPAPNGSPPQGRTVSVAGNVAGQDFVDAFPGSISGEVFNDANSNGVLDSGETGIGGWTVYLDTNGNGQFDPGEPSQTTAANGSYSFAGLATGTYTVRTVPQTGYQPTSPAGGSYTVQAQAGSTVTGNNFGNFQLGSISGQVFTDANGNGTLDAGETGLSGWTVYLDANNNGVLDAGETSQTTGPNGGYSFTNLAPGTYTVRIVPQSGYQLIAPAGGSYSIPVVSGTTATGRNFAEFQPGSIAGQVFADTNGNGILDGAETGVAGWMVYLDTNNNGVLNAGEPSQLTGANGSYSFTGLSAGTYAVRVVPQTGYQTTRPAGGSYSVPMQSGTAATANDFGVFLTGSISGQVFRDTNGNGQLDAGETGLGGWTVYLDTNGNGTLDAGEPSQITPASGNYSFTGLSAGSYTVRVVQPAGYQTTTPAGGAYAVPVQWGTVATGQNFGSFQLGSIAGQVFTDTNGNGQLDAGETGLAGWTVYLDTNGNGTFDAGEPSQVTTANGSYSFTGLSAGTYTVRIVQQSPYQPTGPAGGSYSVLVQSGTAATGKNFGNFQPGSISGEVFTDTNGNGQLDAGETGLAGLTVYLDTNGNGVFDAGEPSQVTSAGGNYTFTGLAAGTYTVRLVEQAGYQLTGPSGGFYSVAVQSGTAATARNFANFQLGSISGQVFADANGNGQLDAGETGLSGWIVYLDTNNNGQLDGGEPYRITDATGAYSFTGLLAGNYTVRVVQQSGYQSTSPAGGSWPVPVQSGTAAAGKNFGTFQLGSISGEVFTDTNGNGQLDAGESGLGGWTVYVDANGNGQLDPGETSQVTAANGSYSFTGLPAGTYAVRIVEQPGYQATSPVGGFNLVPVQSGTAATAINFGNFQLGSISGQVFNDTNGNGQLDTGEPGLAGWTVYLDANNNGQLDPGETTAITNSAGNYSFTGLASGTYIVRAVEPPGYQLTRPAAGSYSVPVQSGAAATGRNFGSFQLGSISGEVFTDTNGNGQLDAGETGLSGWTVYLDTNGNGTLDPGETSQLTGANGSYSFPGLATGTYTVRVVGQPGYQLTGPVGGSWSVAVQSGTTATAKNFGSFQLGSIAGQVFADTNANGQLDTGETGLAGWIVYLDANNNGQLDSGETYAITDANGDYSFAGLSAGTYTVRVVQHAGYQTTGPASGSYSVPVTSGTAATGTNFGSFLLGSITGQVFADTNANGQLDPGETGLGGWDVYLDTNNNGVHDPGEPFRITAADGTFIFTALPAGTYTVRIVQPAGFQPTSPAAGFYPVTIQWATAMTTADFGQQAISGIPATPGLMAVSDTGISNTDRLTNLNNSSPATALEFSVAQTVPGATVALYADGKQIGSTVATSTTTVVATDGTTLLADGPHTFTAGQTAPGEAASGTSTGLAVTIETAPPATPAVAPSLAPGSDTGISTTDNITADLTPTFLSSATPYFRLYRNGVQISGNYETASYTAGAQPLGGSSFTVTAVDAAGNESGQSPPLTVTFDNTQPVATINPPVSNPMFGPVDPMQIVFTKPVYGFDLAHLSLSRDGFPMSLATATLQTTDNVHFALTNLASLTSLPGTYVLSATNTNVTDAAGNTLANSPTQTWTNSLLAGTGGNDQVKIVRDATDPTLADVYVNSDTTSFQLRFGDLPLLQASLGDGNDTLTVDFTNGSPLPAGGTTYDGGTGDNTLAVVLPPGPNALTAGPASFLFNTTPIALAGVQSVAPIGTDGTDTLTVAAGTSLTLAALPGKNLFLSGLSIADTATLDLGQNSLVLAYGASSPLAQLTQDIVNGRDSLPGPKLISTATAARPSALGIVDNQMLHLSTWNGQTIDDGTHQQVIVKFTYLGDTNLDGQVTQADLYNVIANQGGSGGWFAGDVNLDGDIDATDLQVVLANMGAGTGGSNGATL
ncbi:MAG: SdrD B-like domain-containing protein [Tepidisphaerales bacterium]